MLDFTKHFATRLARLATPQAERIPATTQVPNSAGGYAWPVDKWTRFDRFLIFGSERGTYYIPRVRAHDRERDERARVHGRGWTSRCPSYRRDQRGRPCAEQRPGVVCVGDVRRTW